MPANNVVFVFVFLNYLKDVMSMFSLFINIIKSEMTHSSFFMKADLTVYFFRCKTSGKQSY